MGFNLFKEKSPCSLFDEGINLVIIKNTNDDITGR